MELSPCALQVEMMREKQAREAELAQQIGPTPSPPKPQAAASIVPAEAHNPAASSDQGRVRADSSEGESDAEAEAEAEAAAADKRASMAIQQNKRYSFRKAPPHCSAKSAIV
jgi:hypothetical protein